MEGKAVGKKGEYESGWGSHSSMNYLEHVFNTLLIAIGRTALLHKPQGKSISCQAKQTAHLQNLTEAYVLKIMKNKASH